MARRTLFLLTTLLLLCQPLFALDLHTAKQQGLVGETPTGYLGLVAAGNPQAQQVVDTINAKRKAHYQSIAQKNKLPLQQVEVLAGKKAMAKTPPGQFILTEGVWKKK
ncbi:MAG: hypothetical protein CSA21_06695 [Deltaproteobacteria bacterium]|nr:MAG: hypothetical protein CSA21_06695 [Deltaproteobacteria bacterium]